MKRGEKIHCYFEILKINKLPLHYDDITTKAIKNYPDIFPVDHTAKRTNASLSAELKKTDTLFKAIGDGYYTLNQG